MNKPKCCNKDASWIDQMIPIWRRIGPPKKLKDSLSNDG